MSELLLFLSSSGLAFGVIVLAEIGDKSQLVCMTLAAKHRARPVLIGASLAFLVLNTLAVTVGASIALWIPQSVIAVLAGALFALFGIQALRQGADDDDEEVNAEVKSSRSLVLSTFSLIFIAELGDKTQIAVAGMSSSLPPIQVWIGSSLALVFTSALGVFAGSRLLSRMNPILLHRLSGVFFLLLAALSFASLWI